MSYSGSERTQPQEPVIAILEDFVKPRFMGLTVPSTRFVGVTGHQRTAVTMVSIMRAMKV